MSGALQTLVEGAEFGQRTLFLNAQFHSALPSDVVVQQYFKPYVSVLERSGFDVLCDVPDDAQFDSVLVLVPKNVVEAQYIIARGSALLRDDGALYVAADNKAGGTRLSKWLSQLGLEDVQSQSRNKARLCRAYKSCNLNLSTVLEAGQEQQVLGGDFISQAGVFGWDKIDKGSEILTQHLPQDLKGQGADFGCGYGYLSDFLLQHNNSISKLYCLDADFRSVGLCKKNLEEYDLEKEFIWCDLVQEQKSLRNLNFAIMNPPFHDGKKQDIETGLAFIENAHKALRRNGVLYMVANAHLPYEKKLEHCFFHVEKLYEGQGFKVYKATR